MQKIDNDVVIAQLVKILPEIFFSEFETRDFHRRKFRPKILANILEVTEIPPLIWRWFCQIQKIENNVVIAQLVKILPEIFFSEFETRDFHRRKFRPKILANIFEVTEIPPLIWRWFCQMQKIENNVVIAQLVKILLEIFFSEFETWEFHRQKFRQIF